MGVADCIRDFFRRLETADLMGTRRTRFLTIHRLIPAIQCTFFHGLNWCCHLRPENKKHLNNLIFKP